METGMKKRNLKIVGWCAPIALVIGLGSLAAHADSYYNSGAAWTAALSGSPTTVNFEGIAPDNSFVSYGVGPGSNTTVGGVNFAVGAAGTDNIFFILGDGYYSYPMSTISLQPFTFNDPADLLITLPSAVTALGFDFGNFSGDGTATITLSDGSVQTVTAPASWDLAFFGVTAPGGITSVEITVPNSYGLQLADLSYGTAATATPEPSSFLLLGSGVLALAGMMRRKMGFGV
jgi:hypothetical protein